MRLSETPLCQIQNSKKTGINALLRTILFIPKHPASRIFRRKGSPGQHGPAIRSGKRPAPLPAVRQNGAASLREQTVLPKYSEAAVTRSLAYRFPPRANYFFPAAFSAA